MKRELILEAVRSFLAERGYEVPDCVEDVELHELGSLEFVSMLMAVERSLNVKIDDSIFFAEGLPYMLHALCERLALAIEGERIG